MHRVLGQSADQRAEVRGFERLAEVPTEHSDFQKIILTSSSVELKYCAFLAAKLQDKGAQLCEAVLQCCLKPGQSHGHLARP